jgi:hypothetical protein
MGAGNHRAARFQSSLLFDLLSNSKMFWRWTREGFVGWVKCQR